MSENEYTARLNEYTARLRDTVDAIVPGGLKPGDDWREVAIRLLRRAYSPNLQPTERAVADAITEATENPGRVVPVKDAA